MHPSLASIFDATWIYIGIAVLGAACWRVNRKQEGPDRRQDQWLACSIALAVVFGLTGAFFGALMPFTLLVQVLVTSPLIATTSSLIIHEVLHGFHSLGSPVPDVSAARHAWKIGRPDEALALALPELAKDQGHYETNYLLSQIYWETHQPLPALRCLLNALENPKLTPEQRAQIQAEFDQAFNLAQRRGALPLGTPRHDLPQLLPKQLPVSTSPSPP